MKKLWDRYARSWSEGREEERLKIFKTCLADNITYCDPMMSTSGYDELSDYMAGFQQQLPGHAFIIDEVMVHHGVCMAKWRLMGKEHGSVHKGTSFAQVDEDGRLSSISGFFPVEHYTS